MIINVRGTHGSGKSTLVRTVMEQHGKREPVFLDGRRQPLGYVCKRKKHTPLFIVGHYETPGGGCDNVPSTDLMFRTIRKYAKRGFHVLYEGILAQHSTPNILKLHDRFSVRVIVLDVPLKKAIRSVKKRRKARGDLRPFDPKNVIKEQRSVRNATRRLKDQGLRVKVYSSRVNALNAVSSLLENHE